MSEASNSPNPHWSLAELKELAIEADIYVNDPPRRKEKLRRIREVIPMLDDVAKPLYVEKPVILFGVHGRANYDRRRAEFKRWLSPGRVEGISEGFAYVNYDLLLGEARETGDVRQIRLAAELRERSIGSIGITHLVHRQQGNVTRTDQLTSIFFVNRAFAPVASSELFPSTVRPEILTSPERVQEIDRILSIGSSELKDTLMVVDEMVRTADDPLRGVADCAPVLTGVFQSGNEVNINALHDYIEHTIGPKVFGRVYTFADRPPASYFEPRSGSISVGSFEPETEHSMLITSFAVGKRLVEEGDAVTMEDGLAFFAVAHQYDHGVVGEAKVFLPCEGLANAQFEEKQIEPQAPQI